MPTYDSILFDPPAPLARVGLRSLQSGNSVADVPMLIDSGADLTAIPITFIDQLGWDIEGEEGYELQGFDGHTSVARSVQLELTFLSRTFKGRFVVLNTQIGVLGRNVLNHFPLLLDGPDRTWREMANVVK
jgi:hypothetical protein